ncbi:PAS domain-containing sensor histidine kinase [Streptococcus infantarius subsp. infantarius]|uniref:ATP-binding protein n=2 Tax=Streptococcus infantarius TaxID=102684 RepID=UPI001BD98716|nr:ATP-binding protein [Streptococcus infantarius]MBT0900334.1 PAS domain-containing sensor histidine kinase [Streptococcus infantarius subsp. infantarius]MBT1033970.1 PAS domain-containing sensor histidine kinase [Streptococcus infantarius subsp. infantarius]MCO4602563.1 phosphate regulon sensor protein phoR [Streptococcus infantarius subsp. infantarius]MCO4608322.1 phosphate regulon sensor protein phoR [Streptococcus infantarius subsp. infantarius]MCO4623625.1 phosphate regulon sensor protei
MIKKIFRSTFFATLGVLLVTLFMVVGLLYGYFTQVQKEQLQTETALAAQGVSLEGQDYFNELKMSNVRITWVDNQGKVLYDNESDAQIMDNHANREEIKEALKDGYGESVRYSKTLTTQSLYSAQRLDNGTVIRLSVTRHSILVLLFRMFQPLFLILVLAFLLSLWLSHSIAKSIVLPLNRLDLDHPLENDAYEEISPLLRRIARHQKEVTEREVLLEQRQSEFDTIISKIKEGMILLDNNCRIISINQAAQDILQTDQTCLGKDMLQILRNLSLNNWLEKGLQGRKQEGILQLDDAHYKVMVRPIQSEDKVTGLAILFFDVTDQLQAEQLRREFTANVSHELKTPLHLISGYSEMLASDVVAQKDVPQFAEKIHSESQRMIQLVEDIIKLSHLDESEELAMEPVNLYQISEEVLDSLSAKANERHINLHLLGEPAYITGNHALIHSLIYNLCDNAIIYNRDKGDVTVNVISNKDNIVLTVQDTGVGIAKDEQERIFERFYRVDKSRSKKLGGTGLGLSIVKHAVNQHHADIKVESQLGLGTKMTVTFYK